MNRTELKILMVNCGDKNSISVCSKCGSPEVQIRAWVDANTKKYIDDDAEDPDDHWCEKCCRHAAFCTLQEFEDRMDRDIANSTSPEAEDARKDWDKKGYIEKRDIWFNLRKGEKEYADARKTLSHLQKIRDNATTTILSFLKRYGEIRCADIDEGCSPIIQKGRHDFDTYTLDDLELNDDSTFSADAGSSNDNISLEQNDINAEALTDIAQWLKDNEESIIENFINNNCDQEDIDEIHGILAPLGEVTEGEESIDDALDSEDDNYIMLRPFKIDTGTIKVHLKLYYGDCTRIVSCIETDFVSE